MLRIDEVALANTRCLYEYRQNCNYKITFNIKGFDYGWLLTSHRWKSGEKVLDVGGAYSPFPNYLSTKFNCETWVADDFGVSEGSAFWTRGRSPEEHIVTHPETKYVLERIGDPTQTSLPKAYFDTIYSASALEHVPPAFTPAVWTHMVELLKPGGELIHAVDVPFPSNGGFKKMLQAMIFDGFPWLFPHSFRVNHFLATPKNYARIVFKTLNIYTRPSLKNLNIWRMSLNPEILCEPVIAGWYRITKDNMKDYHFQRVGSLLLRFKKLS